MLGACGKSAQFPLHVWLADAMEGPTPVSALIHAATMVTAGVYMVTRCTPLFLVSPTAQIVVACIGGGTALMAGLIAMTQFDLKRILAYSSIAHAGYILVAILAQDGSSLLFYFVVYLFMNIGAFAAIIAMGKQGKEYLELEDYAGIGFKYPWIGATFAVFLISLAGLPPMGGFLAKFYVFSAAVNQGHISLVIIGVLASLISVYYYLRIIIYMYMREPTQSVDIHVENPALFMVLFLCLYGVLQMGIFPGNILIIIKQAVASIGLF